MALYMYHKSFYVITMCLSLSLLKSKSQKGGILNRSLNGSRTHTHTRTLSGINGTGETLQISQREKSPLWIQSPEESSRV